MGVSGAKGRSLNGRARCAARRPRSTPNFAEPLQAHDTPAPRFEAALSQGEHDRQAPGLGARALSARRRLVAARSMSAMDTPKSARARGIEVEAQHTQGARGIRAAARPRFAADTPSRARSHSYSPNWDPSPKACRRSRRLRHPRALPLQCRPTASRRSRASWAARPTYHPPRRDRPSCRWGNSCQARCRSQPARARCPRRPRDRAAPQEPRLAARAARAESAEVRRAAGRNSTAVRTSSRWGAFLRRR